MNLYIEVAPNGWIVREEPRMDGYTASVLAVFNNIDEMNLFIKQKLLESDN